MMRGHVDHSFDGRFACISVSVHLDYPLVLSAVSPKSGQIRRACHSRHTPPKSGQIRRAPHSRHTPPKSGQIRRAPHSRHTPQVRPDQTRSPHCGGRDCGDHSRHTPPGSTLLFLLAWGKFKATEKVLDNDNDDMLMIMMIIM